MTTVEYPLMHESVWFEQARYEKAEASYQVHLVQTKYGTNSPAVAPTGATTTTTTGGGVTSADQTSRIEKLEKENQDLRKLIDGLTTRIQQIELRVGSGAAVTVQETTSKPAAKVESDDDDDDEDDDLFGGSDDEEELEKIREEKALAAQKALAAKGKKKVVIAKSSVLFDVKGYDDETNWPEIEIGVRAIEMKGLTWGASKILDHVYGVKKLQILSTIVDDDVSVEELKDKIEDEFEDVQSVDIAAFNKI